jgi:hypothetical protein
VPQKDGGQNNKPDDQDVFPESVAMGLHSDLASGILCVQSYFQPRTILRSRNGLLGKPLMACFECVCSIEHLSQAENRLRIAVWARPLVARRSGQYTKRIMIGLLKHGLVYLGVRKLVVAFRTVHNPARHGFNFLSQTLLGCFTKEKEGKGVIHGNRL